MDFDKSEIWEKFLDNCDKYKIINDDDSFNLKNLYNFYEGELYKYNESGMRSFISDTLIANMGIDYLLSNSGSTISPTIFALCDSLKNLTIPKNIKYICSNAFSTCRNLTEVNIPGNMQTLSNSVFAYCENLKSVKINSCDLIEMYVFSHCTNLKDVEILNGSLIGTKSFEYCNNLTNIKLPPNLTTIGQRAFQNCISLKELEIPENITYIGEEIFGGCISLERVKIPTSFKSNLRLVLGFFVFNLPKNILQARSKSHTINNWSGKNVNIEFYDGTSINLNDIVDEIIEQEKTKNKEWYRIGNNMHKLICNNTNKNKEIRCYYKNIQAATGKDCSLFFKTKQDALDFLAQNNYNFGAFKINPNDIYVARLGSLDMMGFTKVKTKQGEAYIQGWKADQLGIMNPILESLHPDIEIDETSLEGKIEEIDKFINDIYKLRKDSIADKGEYAEGNAIFKEFRNKGYLDKLKDLKNNLKSQQLSIEENLCQD